MFVSVAIKNAILMFLIIMIFHFLIKNYLIDKKPVLSAYQDASSKTAVVQMEHIHIPQTVTQPQQQSIIQEVEPALDVQPAQPKQASDSIFEQVKKDEDELLQYVLSAAPANEPILDLKNKKPDELDGMFANINGFDSADNYFPFEKLN